MRFLVLGGTVFLGRAVARHALAAGYDVTCVARGSSGETPEGARFVAVDRDDPDGLSVLDGERFDAVVDVTRRPSHARRAVAALKDRVGHWTYVSSISVYPDTATPDQHADTARLWPPAPPEMDPPTDVESYGRCKVSCEQAVRDDVARALICRAGLIVGPEDEMDRFPYWVARFARGGRVLAPGAPDDLVQLIDVRDLAGWLVASAETGRTGTYDVTSPTLTRAEMFDRIMAAVGSDATVTWVSQEFLQEHEVGFWSGKRALPIWTPLPEFAGFLTHDVSPALSAGLTFRPLVETAAATWEWYAADPRELTDGLTPEEETDLLARWDAAPVTGSG